MSFDGMKLKVTCPCCMTEDSLILLGDDKQSMQCLHCGYASSSDYKENLSDVKKAMLRALKKVETLLP